MIPSRNSVCDRIALVCAAGALLISAGNLALWHIAPRSLLGLIPSFPVMVPNSALAIALPAAWLLAACVARGPARNSVMAPVFGLLLLVIGGAYLAEPLSGRRLWINHAYFDSFLARNWNLPLNLDVPSLHSGMGIVLLGIAFLLWRRHYRLAQVFLLTILLLVAFVLLGHVYELPDLYRLPAEAPVTGMSLLSASSLALLCLGLLFFRPGESVVRFALRSDPKGAFVTRFGIGALATLAGFGFSALLRYFVATPYLPVLKISLAAAAGTGIVLLVYSTVRALDRMEKDHQRAVEDLEQSREQLLFAQKLAKVAYWQWNLLSDEVNASDEWFRILGLNRAEGPVRFADLLRTVHPEDRRRLTEIAYGSIAGRCFFSVDWRALRSDGEIVHVHSQASVELDLKGRPWRLRGASLDVTELKRAEVSARQAEERVRVLLEKANEAVRVREDVLSIVSHDLKNPLTAASLSAQLLLRQLNGTPTSASLARTAANIQRSVENMKTLVQGILDVGKIQSGTFSVDLTPLDPGELLQFTNDVLQPIARDRGIELQFSAAPTPPIRGDRGRLQQVLLNLIGNALKFTPRGGHVCASYERDGGRLIFLVEDDGPGIPPELQRHLFERNWQAPATASGGNGLGLFIAKGIVDAHRGHIWLENKSGRGCRFRFSVPEADSEGVLDAQARQGVESSHRDVGCRGGVHVPESVVVASLQFEREVGREVDIYPEAGHA